MLVTNNLRGVIRLLRGKVELLPGENTVDDELWNQAKGSPQAQQLIAHKQIQVAAGGKAATPLPTKPPAPSEPVEEVRIEEAPLTKDMTAKDAINLVKASADADWLQLCLEDESRSTVIDAIEGQLEILSD